MPGQPGQKITGVKLMCASARVGSTVPIGERWLTGERCKAPGRDVNERGRASETILPGASAHPGPHGDEVTR